MGPVSAIVVGKIFLEESTFKQEERRKARLQQVLLWQDPWGAGDSTVRGLVPAPVVMVLCRQF